jgi:hypothetical protein
MAEALPIGKIVSIRDCGYDEVWLQDQIVASPSSLRLGDLEVVMRERIQSSGGRLDILLKDPEDESMYEVEVMLGETDETHIIRTIEYWTREKRKWPQRQHYPVLVAENITRRFFDVIQVMSHAIPMIAVQANIIESNGHRILAFNKILDAYEEPEDSEPADNESHDEAYWIEKASATNDAAKVLLAIVTPVLEKPEVHYVKNYVSIAVNGNNYLWFHRRAANKSLLSFWVGERLMGKAKALLDAKGISYTVHKNRSIRVTTDKERLTSNSELFKELAELVKQAWTE